MVLSILALLAAAPAQGSMSVAEFLAKADGLERKGMLAMFSSDVGVIKREAKLDIDAFAAELTAAAKAHRPLPACPPKTGDSFQFTIKSDELLQYYHSLPAQRRSMTSRDAFAAFMAAKYPCR